MFDPGDKVERVVLNALARWTRLWLPDICAFGDGWWRRLRKSRSPVAKSRL